MPEKDLFDITGKAAIVTGASRGLGRAFAEVLAEYGADVACIGRDQSKLKETIDIISSYGHKAVSIAADVSDADDVKRMVDQAVKEFDKIDILINNAGIAGVNYKIHEMPIKSWDDVMNANLKSQFLCMKEVIPYMLKNKGGSIVNISSNAGLRGDGNMIPPTYGVSKAGIISLTEYAAMQYVRDNIRVNAIAPGMHKSNLGHPDDSEQSKQLDKAIEEFCSANVPMGRQADASELKGLIILLASNASSFITGQVFVQDGGQITQL
ncbi:MAG: SDR family oxidoreductase [Spirochaetes bacterium]|nr:SDR family oxidoreductase [Spirochaetota bacterium]